MIQRRFAALILALLLARSAMAAQRTFVSAASGSDANLCTRPAPCRNFTAAMSHTDPGGEVVALDSGGYGSTTVNQSISLVGAPGVHAAITAVTGDAILISAGPADIVMIRNLYLNGLGGVNGIVLDTGHVLHVERAVLSGFSDTGLLTLPDGARVYVSETVSRQNQTGFHFFSSGAATQATLSLVRAEENLQNGFLVNLSAQVTATDSVAIGHPTAGFWAGSANSVLILERCTSAFNVNGIVSRGTTRVSNCVITDNSVGIQTGLDGGSLISSGNNLLAGNNTDGTFNSTIGQQ